MTYSQWKQMLEATRQLVESLRPEKILAVGPWLMGEMAAYSNSPVYFRRRRAECLTSAIAFKLIGMETGRDHSAAIKHHLSRAAEWRRKEKPAPVVLRKAA